MASHLVEAPVAVIQTTILVEELAFAMAHTINLFSFVTTSLAECLFNKSHLAFFWFRPVHDNIYRVCVSDVVLDIAAEG